MSNSKPKKIATSDSRDLAQNPFASLDLPNLPSSTVSMSPASPMPASNPTPTQFKGRIDIRRETHGRHGKTVTSITPETPLSESDAKDLTQLLKHQLGCGGTFKEDHIEIQGDRRSQAKPILENLGFRVVFSGG